MSPLEILYLEKSKKRTAWLRESAKRAEAAAEDLTTDAREMRALADMLEREAENTAAILAKSESNGRMSVKFHIDAKPAISAIRKMLNTTAVVVPIVQKWTCVYCEESFSLKNTQHFCLGIGTFVEGVIPE